MEAKRGSHERGKGGGVTIGLGVFQLQPWGCCCWQGLRHLCGIGRSGGRRWLWDTSSQSLKEEERVGVVFHGCECSALARYV